MATNGEGFAVQLRARFKRLGAQLSKGGWPGGEVDKAGAQRVMPPCVVGKRHPVYIRCALEGEGPPGMLVAFECINPHHYSKRVIATEEELLVRRIGAGGDDELEAVPDDGRMTQLGVRVPMHLRRRLEAFALEEGRTMADVMREAIEQHIGGAS